jgi:hypothetical protein
MQIFFVGTRERPANEAIIQMISRHKTAIFCNRGDGADYGRTAAESNFEKTAIFYVKGEGVAVNLSTLHFMVLLIGL